MASPPAPKGPHASSNVVKSGEGWRVPHELWQARRMASPNPSAAGAPLALLIVAGAVIGGILHQPLLGALIGITLGVAIAVAVWLRDRNRIGH